jgi:hypothetical protein
VSDNGNTPSAAVGGEGDEGEEGDATLRRAHAVPRDKGNMWDELPDDVRTKVLAWRRRLMLQECADVVLVRRARERQERTDAVCSSLVRCARSDAVFAALFTRRGFRTDWETAVLRDYDKRVTADKRVVKYLEEIAEYDPWYASSRSRELIVKHLGVPTDTMWYTLNDAAGKIQKEHALRLRDERARRHLV